MHDIAGFFVRNADEKVVLIFVEAYFYLGFLLFVLCPKGIDCFPVEFEASLRTSLEFGLKAEFFVKICEGNDVSITHWITQIRKRVLWKLLFDLFVDKTLSLSSQTRFYVNIFWADHLFRERTVIEFVDSLLSFFT
jgi:hypothetical protein